jgi:hypothetical protein
MLIQETKSLIAWPAPLVELLGFAALFLASGAVGFRYAVLRGGLRGAASADPAAPLFGRAARRAAAWGLAGAVLRAALSIASLPAAAQKAHLSAVELVVHDAGTGIPLLLWIVAIVGFAIAASGRRSGWPVAAVGVVLGAMPPLFTGQWLRLINPIHALAAGLWIGTLFVMVVAGISLVLRDESMRAERERIVAEMVHAFSPVALTMGVTVVLFGVITAWRHLNPLSSLFTTPYGYALLAKLCAVALVFGLGAWNWRRQRPLLGTEDSAASIQRSARAELWAAAVVLVITAILISLPSPRPPKPSSASTMPPVTLAP